MVIEIDRFKSAVSAGGGLSQSNLYMVELPTTGFDGITMNTLNLMCKRAQLPGKQITTAERVIGVKPIKQAYGYLDNDDLNFSFHVTNDFKVKTYFERWQTDVYNTDTESLQYHDDYVRDVKIHVLKRPRNSGNGQTTFLTADFQASSNEVANKVYSCQLIDAFPTTVQAIDLDNEQNGMIELNVQLSFRKWRTL